METIKKGKVEITICDGKIILGENNNVQNCIFNVVHRVDLAELKLDTFMKRLKWLFLGKYGNN